MDLGAVAIQSLPLFQNMEGEYLPCGSSMPCCYGWEKTVEDSKYLFRRYLSTDGDAGEFLALAGVQRPKGKDWLADEVGPLLRRALQVQAGTADTADTANGKYSRVNPGLCVSYIEQVAMMSESPWKTKDNNIRREP